MNSDQIFCTVGFFITILIYFWRFSWLQKIIIFFKKPKNNTINEIDTYRESKDLHNENSDNIVNDGLNYYSKPTEYCPGCGTNKYVISYIYCSSTKPLCKRKYSHLHGHCKHMCDYKWICGLSKINEKEPE